MKTQLEHQIDIVKLHVQTIKIALENAEAGVRDLEGQLKHARIRRDSRLEELSAAQALLERLESEKKEESES